MYAPQISASIISSTSVQVAISSTPPSDATKAQYFYKLDSDSYWSATPTEILLTDPSWVSYTYSNLTTTSYDFKARFANDTIASSDSNILGVDLSTSTTYAVPVTTTYTDIVNVDTVRKLTNSVTIITDTKRSVTKSLQVVADTFRKVLNSVTVNSDTKRSLTKTVQVPADTNRKLTNNVTINADTKRKVSKIILIVSDTKRALTNSIVVNFDTVRKVTKNVTVLVDTLRWLKQKVKIGKKDAIYSYTILPEKYTFKILK